MGVKKEDLVRWIGGLEALKDDVPEEVKQQRVDRVMALQNRIATEKGLLKGVYRDQ